VPQSAEDLRRTLRRIDGHGYKAYREIRGAFAFEDLTLHVDHVQGDPFAAPSKLRLRVPRQAARISVELFANAVRRVALEDFLARQAARAIRRGDLIHCDIGICYLGLCTDMQHNAYVLRLGEEDAPAGLKKLLGKANRVQEILLNEFAGGRTGNEILRSALTKAKAEGLGPRIYTHPVGFYGHGSGMTIGMTEKQDFVPGTGEHPLHLDTVYAIELSASSTVPDWGNATVSMGVEDQGCFTRDGPRWVDGYPRSLYLIK